MLTAPLPRPLFSQYMLDAALNGVIGFWSALNKGLGAGERVFELIDRKPQIDPLAGKALAPTRAGSLRLECVSFAYPSRPEAPILRNLNLSIARGESVAIWCVPRGLHPRARASLPPNPPSGRPAAAAPARASRRSRT